MAQRWLQAKIQLGKLHGTTVSGAGRAMGMVFEDRPVGKKTSEPLPAPKLRLVERHHRTICTVTKVKRIVNGTVCVRKTLDKMPKSLARKLASVTIQP